MNIPCAALLTALACLKSAQWSLADCPTGSKSDMCPSYKAGADLKGISGTRRQQAIYINIGGGGGSGGGGGLGRGGLVVRGGGGSQGRSGSKRVSRGRGRNYRGSRIKRAGGGESIDELKGAKQLHSRKPKAGVRKQKIVQPEVFNYVEDAREGMVEGSKQLSRGKFEAGVHYEIIEGANGRDGGVRGGGGDGGGVVQWDRRQRRRRRGWRRMSRKFDH